MPVKSKRPWFEGLTWWRALVTFSTGLIVGLAIEHLTRPTPALALPPGLLPAFAARVTTLLKRLHARGYNPVLLPPEDAQDSLSRFGASVHVINIGSQNGAQSDPGFLQALDEESDFLSLTWGGKWRDSSRDITLVQAIPYFLESEFRALEAQGSRELFLRETYAT